MGMYEREFKSGPMVDHSGTIAANATAQDVCGSNGSRRFFMFQNVSVTDMWLNFGTDAVADSPSVKVAAGLAFPVSGNWCPTDRVSVICSTLGKKFTCKTDV